MPTLKHTFIETRGFTTHVAQCGNGPPLILLHGWPEFWAVWEPMFERLADRYRLIAPDFRGFGESGNPDAGPSDQAGPDVLADDIAALMDGARHRAGGLRRPRCRRLRHAAAGAQPSRQGRRTVLLQLRHARRRRALARAQADQRDLVPDLPPDAVRAGPGRRQPRTLPRLFRLSPDALVVSQGCLRRRAGALGRQLHAARQSAGRLQLVHLAECRPAGRDGRHRAQAAQDHAARARAVGPARSGAAERLDRRGAASTSKTSRPASRRMPATSFTTRRPIRRPVEIDRFFKRIGYKRPSLAHSRAPRESLASSLASDASLDLLGDDSVAAARPPCSSSPSAACRRRAPRSGARARG